MGLRNAEQNQETHYGSYRYDKQGLHRQKEVGDENALKQPGNHLAHIRKGNGTDYS